MDHTTDEQTRRLEWLNRKCLLILSALSLLLMVLLIILGLLTMALGIYPMFCSSFRNFAFEIRNNGSLPTQVSPTVAFALGVALDGLEFVFLAPLAFLLLHGIWDFMNDVNRGHFRDSKAFPTSPLFLIRIKGLIIGLMIAVVATELLKKTVGEHGLSYESAIAGGILIAVLAAYSFIIERSSPTRRERSDRMPGDSP
jgi:hypothetical protein